MQNMGWLTNSLAAGIASNKKINKILAEEAGIKDAPDAVKDADPDGEISFNDVSFSMNGRKILDGISFELPVGKTLGIMGVTGSGKSTIVNLIGRLPWTAST